LIAITILSISISSLESLRREPKSTFQEEALGAYFNPKSDTPLPGLKVYAGIDVSFATESVAGINRNSWHNNVGKCTEFLIPKKYAFYIKWHVCELEINQARGEEGWIFIERSRFMSLSAQYEPKRGNCVLVSLLRKSILCNMIKIWDEIQNISSLP
jgi:hypothetical protein